MAENVGDTEQGGVKSEGVPIFLYIRRRIGVDLWCRDVGGSPLHGMGPGGFPIPGGVATYGAASTAEAGRKVGVYLSGSGEIGGRV